MKNKLIKLLPAAACSSGVGVLKRMRNNKETSSLFWEYVDFCLATDFPSVNFLKSHITEANSENIFVDEDRTFESINPGAFLGRSSSNLIFKEFDVSKIYVKHKSRISVKASGNSFTLIDALDSSHVEVEALDDAKVIVFLYGNATCNGATKIINKNLQTYILSDNDKDNN